jgi:cytochrome c peroxidase
MKKTVVLAVLLIVFAGAASCGRQTGKSAVARLTPMEALGKALFFDENLSEPPGQSCAACHGPEVGMTGPDAKINIPGGVYEGAVSGRFGNRKPPSAAYAGASPVLHQSEDGSFVGGMFWDGRATGANLDDPLAEQAMGPFLNPVEQNMPDMKTVVLRVKTSGYARLFEDAWGTGPLESEKDFDVAFERIARSIAAYERSTEVNPYNSRFDDFWRKARTAGLDVEAISEENMKTYSGLGLDESELRGLAVFNTKGMCSKCHVLSAENGKPPVFTDYTFDNLGIPRNPDNPFYAMPAEFNPDGERWVDRGLGHFLEESDPLRDSAAANIGKHKVPTLRNVDLRPRPDFPKAYMHNGAFKSLKDVVHFYNTRDVAGAGWPEPEVKDNLNTTELGNLGLSDSEEDAIVAFMKTLSDRT